MYISPYNYSFSVLSLSLASLLSTIGHTTVHVFRATAETIAALGHYAVMETRISAKMAEFASKCITIYYTFCQDHFLKWCGNTSSTLHLMSTEYHFRKMHFKCCTVLHSEWELCVSILNLKNCPCHRISLYLSQVFVVQIFLNKSAYHFSLKYI